MVKDKSKKKKQKDVREAHPIPSCGGLTSSSLRHHTQPNRVPINTQPRRKHYNIRRNDLI